jgi:hypothetical protein
MPQAHRKPAAPLHAGHDDDGFKLTLEEQGRPPGSHAANQLNALMQQLPENPI